MSTPLRIARRLENAFSNTENAIIARRSEVLADSDDLPMTRFPGHANGNLMKHGHATRGHRTCRRTRRRRLRRLQQSAHLPGARESESVDGGAIPGQKADQEGLAERRRHLPAPVPLR